VSELLIRGGAVVDGTGAPAYRGDVRVRHGRIVEIGEGLRPEGEAVLDAGGALVAPGFIDIHTHLDPTLFWDPFADPMPQHGVTTVLTGNCSLSLVPLREPDRAGLISLFSYIEDLPSTAFEQGVPWTWQGYAEYSAAQAAGGLAVSSAALIGHSALRTFVMGEAAWERPATGDEIADQCAILEESLSGGAFGLSTSFFDEDANSRRVPPCLADDAELEALLDVLAHHHGILEFVADFGAGFEQARADVERIGRLCRGRSVVATFGVTQSDRDLRRPELLDLAADLQASGSALYPQISPRAVDARINWERSMAFMPMPRSWHALVRSDDETKLRLLQDAEWRELARREWDAAGTGFFPTTRLDKVRLISVTRAEHDAWRTRSFEELARARGGHPSDVLADWVLENDLRPGVLVSGVANSDVDIVSDMIRHPVSVIGLGDAGAHVGMMCAVGDTTLLLTRHVRDRGDLTVEHGVHALTGRLAELFGFRGRGVLAPDAVADITVFALDELDWGTEVLVEDLPGGGERLRRPPGGYRYTVASGVVTQERGELTGARPATVLDARA
jgi:N-acyl-D-aspartate/D-glutamate deacylase